jgi:3-deoxy-manno-octulosonate cytidylyltransferase (CMP-KDO synthetase)
MRIAIVIPARYESTRFPGKPLATIEGVPMIQWVYYRCTNSIVPQEDIYVATDDERIAKVCPAKVVMTSKHCLTGTDRVYDASKHIPADVIINVQGDEPLIQPADINKLVEAARANPNVVHNAMCRLHDSDELTNRNVPKMVVAPDGRLLYASRACVPMTKNGKVFPSEIRKQVCIYAFPIRTLARFAVHEKTPLEAVEDIEILRFLELGIPVYVTEVSHNSIAVDTPQDLEKVRAILRHQRMVK